MEYYVMNLGWMNFRNSSGSSGGSSSGSSSSGR
jgi:hypothetical protein